MPWSSRKDKISVKELPAEVKLPAAPASPDTSNGGVQNLDDLERNAIIQALAQCHGNKKKAAQVLGIQRPTLYNKMKRYAIEL
jgi:DNA-binding NtrC family response regulator